MKNIWNSFIGNQQYLSFLEKPDLKYPTLFHLSPLPPPKHHLPRSLLRRLNTLDHIFPKPEPLTFKYLNPIRESETQPIPHPNHLDHYHTALRSYPPFHFHPVYLKFKYPFMQP